MSLSSDHVIADFLLHYWPRHDIVVVVQHLDDAVEHAAEVIVLTALNMIFIVTYYLDILGSFILQLYLLGCF